jgi:hypothetical protein
MKYTALTLVTAFLALVLGMPVHARASWSQSLNENGWYGGTHYNFTKIEGFIINDPARTEWEGFTTTKTSWTSTIVNPSYAVLEGPAVGGLNFKALFSGISYQGFAWDVVVWKDDTIIGAGQITTGSGFKFTEYTVKNGQILTQHSDYNRSAVPIPNAAWLFGAGLIGLISARRRLLV